MAKYMAILFEKPNDFAKLSPEEIQQVIEKYMAWSSKLGQMGKMRGGEKLKEEGGKHLTLHKGKLSVVDGPYSEAKEVIGGIFLVEAADYAEASQLLSDCPHLQYGRVELREIDPMGA